MSPLDRIEQRVTDQLDETLDRLTSYLTHPAISRHPERRPDVLRLAERVRDDLTALGLHNARVLQASDPDAQPLVAAEWLQAPGRPTVLIYGHLDLQPADEPEWETAPHTATRRGDRLYARGAADDMGGWLSHMAAIRGWLEETGGLPCNLKLVIEGEEEIGSPYLELYMDEHPEVFAADVMVLTDCENPSPELPGLTVSLRGLMELELLCEALDADGHSGLWGNMVPDPANALFKLVSRLLDEDGRLNVGRVPVDQARVDAGHAVPIPAEVIREGAHLTEGVDPIPLRGRSAAEWMWWQPAITVLATTLPTPEQKKNAIRRRASAILSVRLAPGQTGEEMLALLQAELLRDPPGGVKTTLRHKPGWGQSWLYQPKGPAFDAADRAYERVWGHRLVRVGIGGTIPFVALFGRRYGDLPLILNGVIDPKTTAHGPNESLHLGIFAKMVRTNVHLYAELGALEPDSLRG